MMEKDKNLRKEEDTDNMAKRRRRVSFYAHIPGRKKRKRVKFRARWSMVFKPDAVFKAKGRRLITFQVLGSQLKKKREIEADTNAGDDL